MGAMVSGLSAGPAASAIGPERLVFVQCALLLLSLLPNGPIWRRERQMAARGKPKSGAGNSSSAQVADGKREENDAPWYRDPLILSMAFWTFAIIFCKTTFEYQYNVLVAGTVSLNEMVTLTASSTPPPARVRVRVRVRVRDPNPNPLTLTLTLTLTR